MSKGPWPPACWLGACRQEQHDRLKEQEATSSRGWGAADDLYRTSRPGLFLLLRKKQVVGSLVKPWADLTNHQ